MGVIPLELSTLFWKQGLLQEPGTHRLDLADWTRSPRDHLVSTSPAMGLEVGMQHHIWLMSMVVKLDLHACPTDTLQSQPSPKPSNSSGPCKIKVTFRSSVLSVFIVIACYLPISHPPLALNNFKSGYRYRHKAECEPMLCLRNRWDLGIPGSYGLRLP